MPSAPYPCPPLRLLSKSTEGVHRCPKYQTTRTLYRVPSEDKPPTRGHSSDPRSSQTPSLRAPGTTASVLRRNDVHRHRSPTCNAYTSEINNFDLGGSRDIVLPIAVERVVHTIIRSIRFFFKGIGQSAFIFQDNVLRLNKIFTFKSVWVIPLE